MQFLTILGKPIDQVPIPENEYEMEYDDKDVEEGIEPSWVITAKDGSYEMHLYQNKVINTIFLFPKHNTFPVFGYSTATTQQEIQQTRGIPSRSEGERMIRGLGRYGAFDRYDTKELCIHFQYRVGEPKLERITLMLPGVVRRIEGKYEHEE